MPPPVALVLTFVFVGALFWRDSRRNQNSGRAIWIPVIWFFVVGSKFISQWLTLFGIPVGAASQEDGSPIDAVFFFGLIIAGVVVLVRRKISVAEFARNNVWLTVFIVYGFLAITWSDFPFVAFKRWIKTLGHPIMALVVLTDPDRIGALRRVMSRSAFLMLPLSVLFIKYYPEYGRSFDAWTGAATNSGIMNNKNELGYACMIFGLFFLWRTLSVYRIKPFSEMRNELAISGIFLWMVWWLLSMSDSATSLSCVILGGATMTIVSSRIVSKRFLGTYILLGLALAITLQMSIGGYDDVLKALGRNSTLTDRTAVWTDVIALDDSPILGAGFESFWLGERLERMWQKWWWHPIQAHNGYIETYLNLGMVGEVLLVLLLLATFRKARDELQRDLDFGRYRLGVLFAIIVYNYTEATFKGVHLVWTLFYLIAIDHPLQSVVPSTIAERPTAPPKLAPTRYTVLPGAALAPKGRVV